MLLDYLVDVLDLDVLVEHRVGVDQRDRTHGARSQAAGLDDRHILSEPLVFEFFGEGGAHRESTRCYAAAARADQNVALEFIHDWFLRSLMGRRLRLLDEVGTYRSAAHQMFLDDLV